MIPNDQAEAERNDTDTTAQEVPEGRRGQDNATTVKAMLMRLEKTSTAGRAL